MLTEHDVYLLREGTHTRLYEKMGCQLRDRAAHFAVWAPNARTVSVVGAFNEWNGAANPLKPRRDGSGIWEGALRGVARGDAYKYRIVSSRDGSVHDKADPFAFFAEAPSATASRCWTLEYTWGDSEWMARRRTANALRRAVM